MQEILTAISTVGFPIVCCFAIYKTMIDNMKAHVEETNKLRESIDANTALIQRLLDKMGGDVNDKKCD